MKLGDIALVWFSFTKPCGKVFLFLFYVNGDWWNILHRVPVFDKKYWWLLSASVTWDDRILHFKMNYRRNSFPGSVMYFISSLFRFFAGMTKLMNICEIIWHCIATQELSNDDQCSIFKRAKPAKSSYCHFARYKSIHAQSFKVLYHQQPPWKSSCHNSPS